MTYYLRIGDVPRKRHTLHLGPEGNRLAEELMGEEGFSGASSLLYHRYSPSAIVGIESIEMKRSELTPNVPVRPMHLRSFNLTEGGDLVTGRRNLAASSTVTLCVAAADQSSELYRNSEGDELVFIHTGRAQLETVFGRIAAEAGDYVVIPRDDAPLDPERKGHAGARVHLGVDRPHRAAEQIPDADRSAARRRAVLRTRPAPARGPFRHRR